MKSVRVSAVGKRRNRRRLSKQRKLFKRQGRGRIPEGLSPIVEKYWRQRYSLFEKYDQGIKLDEEGWFSVTPEKIAIHHAHHCRAGDVAIDAFTGVGGNAIQLASVCRHVVAIDIDPQKIEMALNNAKIYGVEDFIDFIVGDFFQLAPSLKGDVVFLSPPWGGPSYKKMQRFSLEALKPKGGYDLFQIARTITPNIIMFLPRNIDLLEVEQLSWLYSPPLDIEVEENMVEGHLKGISVYFGDSASAQHCLVFSRPGPPHNVVFEVFKVQLLD